MKAWVALLGETGYEEALTLQERLLYLRQQREITDVFLLLEHPPLLTIGTRGKASNILVPENLLKAQGIGVHKINRGGDVTYHGPGQIVGYPILDLHEHGKDIHLFVSRVEETFIQLLQNEYGITAGRNHEHTGVWVGDEKITAIGFSIKRWVTMHGFAFNVNTNMEHFKWIVPCGIQNKGVTSLKKLLGYELDMQKVNRQVAEYFCRQFDMQYEILDKQTLRQRIGDKNESNEKA